jgi:hypothetical protein
MSAFSDFDPSFETPASFVGRVGVSWRVGEMHKDWYESLIPSQRDSA